MNPENLDAIKKAAGGLEQSLHVFETFLESSNDRHLYQATLCMVEGLRHLHAVDPALLSAANLDRVEAMLKKESGKTSGSGKGRDTFNTGF